MLVPNPAEEHVRGQLYIAGKEVIENAKVYIQLVDATRQDAPARVIAKTELDLAKRPVSSWLPFALSFSWPGPQSDIDIGNATLQVRIEVEGALKYINKVSHAVDLNGYQAARPTVVAEPV